MEGMFRGNLRARGSTEFSEVRRERRLGSSPEGRMWAEWEGRPRGPPNELELRAAQSWARRPKSPPGELGLQLRTAEGCGQPGGPPWQKELLLLLSADGWGRPRDPPGQLQMQS